MNILHVFDYFSPVPGGGTVDIIFNLLKSLNQKGHGLTLYTTNHEIDRSYLDDLSGVNILPFRIMGNLGGFIITPGIINKARIDIKSFDVIHIHCCRSFQNLIVCHYARKHNIPYVIDAHGSAPHGINGSKNYLVFLKHIYDFISGYKILGGASRLIAETKLGAEEYIKLGATDHQISLIHPPIDTDEYSDLPEPGSFRMKYGIGERKVVMFLGRINWIKGIAFLVKSFAGLQGRDLLLVIVGADDGYEKIIRKLIKELGIDEKVLFTGFLSGKEKLAALVDADVLVQPSIYEQAARPSLEAILCDTPVIVSKNTGAGEDIQNMDAGYLVDYGNTEELTNAMQYILDNPNKAKEKTQKAKEYIKSNLSLSAQVEKYEILYNEVINDKK